MKRLSKRNRKLTLIAIVSIIIIAIGYALISTNFNITGYLEVDKTEWDVHFDNVVLSSDNTVNVETELTENGTILTYTGSFKKPGDVCSLIVDVVNDGTIDAMISAITFDGLTEEQEEYMNYSITYLDGAPLMQNESLKVGEREKILVKVEYKYDIQNSQLLDSKENLELRLRVLYVQDDTTGEKSLYRTIAKNAILDNISSDFVTSSTGVNFKAISSDENGKGLYVRSGTENDTYPIYYYRGAVTNNNAKFAGFCWKIVRTTDTGGIKLIYNGIPDSNGNCINTTGASTQIGTSKFNMEATSPTFSAYMYGEIYTIDSTELSSNYLYGNGFSFTDVDSNVSGDGTYKLKITTSDITVSNLNNYHYTCFNTTGECSEINYIYYIDNTTAYYITIKDGKNVSDALDEMMENETDSNIKTYIDNWFKTELITYFTNKEKDYRNYIEDTVWCSDRSFRKDTSGSSFEKSGWNPNGGNNRTYLNYDALGRRDTTGQPRVDCKNKKDAFTVNDTTKGNGLLKYPVGLLTADEVMLAGGWAANNTTYYLYTNTNWWSLSPSYFIDNGAYVFYVLFDGSLGYWHNVTSTVGIRPSISLKHGIKIKSGGDGTSTNPYILLIN